VNAGTGERADAADGAAMSALRGTKSTLPALLLNSIVRQFWQQIGNSTARAAAT